MKSLILNIFFLCSLIPMLSAQKYDYVWVRGYFASEPPMQEFKNSFMDFSTNPPNITTGKNSTPLTNCVACIADSAGKLLFYTNLIKVFNAKEDVMINGEVINYGKTWINYQDIGYPGFSCAKIIPIMNDSLFLMVYGQIHTDVKYILNSPIQYSIIDPYFQNGKGKLLVKDVPFHHTNTLNYDFVRHGNGKDWWLILAEWNVLETKQNYYRYLVNQKGEIDSIGMQSFAFPSYYGGFTKINQKGDTYIKYDSGSKDTNSFTIYNLDRCSGNLTYKKDYLFSKLDNLWPFEISPNGRYLYISKGNMIAQADLESNDPYLFIDTLDVVGPQVGGYPNSFTFANLTPQNEIMLSPSASRAINLIHKPDLPGLSADLEPESIIGPAYASTPPQFPNYRLAALSGSPCDTIGFVNINTEWQSDTTDNQLCLIQIIPKSFSKIALRIYDQQGDNILEDQFISLQSSYCLKTDNLLPGNYKWYLWVDDKKILTGSITIP
ncbi:MAG TPA: hypothetical protein VK590_12990 [Saprospiraceae bacterium]|nr:hypothetical protein [Saprospiraceae bacterium]